MRLTEDRYSRDRLRLDLALRFIRHEARTRTIRQWTGLTDDRIRKLYRSYVRSEPSAGVRRRRGKSPRLASFFTRSQPAQLETAALASIMSICGVLPPVPPRDGVAERPSRPSFAAVIAGPGMGAGVSASTFAGTAGRAGAEAGSGAHVGSATAAGSGTHAGAGGRLAGAASLRSSCEPASSPPARDTLRTLAGVPRGERLCAAYEAYARVIPKPMISFEHAVFLATALAGGAELQALRCAACGSLGVVDPLALRPQLCLDCGETLSLGLRGRLRSGTAAVRPLSPARPRMRGARPRAARLLRQSDH